MSKFPLVSIITVNLNNLEGLKKTMLSVFEQTWQEFEFIVIDGGSTDGSKELIERHDEKIDSWISEPDSGIYNAMNKGIKMATGEYLLFLNSGDHFFNCEILARNKVFINKYDLIYFNLNVVDGDKSYIKEYPEKLSFNYFIMDTLPHPATFIKKSLFTLIGYYDENLKIVADWKFFIISICKANASYHKINKVFSTFYYDGISSDNRNKDEIEQEKQHVLETDFPMFLQENVEFRKLEQKMKNLQKSKRINFLVKIGLIKKIK